MKHNFSILLCIMVSPYMYGMDVSPKSRQLKKKLSVAEKLLIDAVKNQRVPQIKTSLETLPVTTTDKENNSLPFVLLTHFPYTQAHIDALLFILNKPNTNGQMLISQRASDNSTLLEVVMNGISIEASKKLPDDEKRKTNIDFGVQLITILLGHGANPDDEGPTGNAYQLIDTLNLGSELSTYIRAKRDKYLKVAQGGSPVIEAGRGRSDSLNRVAGALIAHLYSKQSDPSNFITALENNLKQRSNSVSKPTVKTTPTFTVESLTNYEEFKQEEGIVEEPITQVNEQPTIPVTIEVVSHPVQPEVLGDTPKKSTCCNLI